MEMSIAFDWGEERLLRSASLLHGCRVFPDRKGRGRAQDCIQKDGREMVYML